MNRQRKQYISDIFPIQKFIKENWKDLNGYYEYAIWGVTQYAEVVIDYISTKYPNAKLVHVYDKKSGLTFRNQTAISPQAIVEYPHETLFITHTSREAGLTFLAKCGKSIDCYTGIGVDPISKSRNNVHEY